jgi:hypothetical protein
MTNTGGNTGKERRASKRRPILDSFSFSVSMPRKGPHRLVVSDISELGIGFHADIEGEEHSDFPLKKGDSLEVHLYLNQSLFLPLPVKVARVEERDGLRYVGAELSGGKETKSTRAYHALIQMLDLLGEVAQISSP